MRRTLLLPLLALAACEHSTVPLPGGGGEEGPFLPATPVQLTYSTGVDRTPQWGDDPGQVLYAFDDMPRTGGGIIGCVGALPAGGGTRAFQSCPIDPTYGSATPAWPAQREDGTLAFQQTWISGFQTFAELARLSPKEGAAPERVILVPFFEPDAGKSMQGVADLHWLSRDSLIFVGLGVVHSLNDNVESGLEIVLLDAEQGQDGLGALPGTEWASSLALGVTTDTVYYTLGGDSLVYRRVRSTGATDTVANFGPLGIARGVQVRAGKLIAVVGGDVTWGAHPSLGMAQYDYGGPLYMVDLSDGIPVAIGNAFDRYFTPALAPDGSAVVAAQFGDLWRITLP